MAVSAAVVKALRDKTGAGMSDCKKALEEAGGDMDKAVEVLRKMGLKDIGKRAGKIAAEGVIGIYAHAGDQIGALVELNCETDFVARGDEFKEAARGIAMHVAAMNPLYVSAEEVPAAVLEKEKEILIEALPPEQKSKTDKLDQILKGKIQKFYEEACLLSQAYIKDEGKTIANVLEDLSAKTGEKVTLRRFARFEVGDGIEKAVTNYADEVAATIAGS